MIAQVFYFMLHMIFVDNMVTISSDRILINESKDESNNVNSTSQTFTVYPLCQSDNAIITDPDGKSLHYNLTARDIAGVMGAHIHVGTSTQNGPVLLTLLNSSTSATPSSNTAISTITSPDIRGNMTAISAHLFEDSGWFFRGSLILVVSFVNVQ